MPVYALEYQRLRQKKIYTCISQLATSPCVHRATPHRVTGPHDHTRTRSRGLARSLTRSINFSHPLVQYCSGLWRLRLALADSLGGSTARRTAARRPAGGGGAEQATSDGRPEHWSRGRPDADGRRAGGGRRVAAWREAPAAAASREGDPRAATRGGAPAPASGGNNLSRYFLSAKFLSPAISTACN
jgi:hypothetical protein